MIVARVALHPRQAITALHLPGTPHAEWCVAIVERDLRAGTKHELADRCKGTRRGERVRREPCTHQFGNRSVRRDEGEGAVSRRHRASREAHALELVAVEERIGRATG